MTLTLAYVTARREPCIGWFMDSLHKECGGNYTDLKLVVVDFYADHPGRRESFAKLAHAPLTHIPPMPNPWCGPHRLTSMNFWAVAYFRNTALCVAPDGYIVYVDDLSVLLPGWLAEVRAAMSGGYVACGSYQKVLGLEVDTDGRVRGYRDHPPGHDTRCPQVFTSDPVPCGGSWLYGNFTAPVEALLSVNGSWHKSSPQGGEDYLLGLMLEKNGFPIRFCPRMAVFESEERHHLPGEHFKRIIKPGHPPHNLDASHVILNMILKDGVRTAIDQPNLRELRRAVLFENQPFPSEVSPTTDWFDGQPLSEM